jgi:hypothetical protein
VPSTKKLNRALRVEVPSPLRSVAPADGELQPGHSAHDALNTDGSGSHAE